MPWLTGAFFCDGRGRPPGAVIRIRVSAWLVQSTEFASLCRIDIALNTESILRDRRFAAFFPSLVALPLFRDILFRNWHRHVNDVGIGAGVTKRCDARLQSARADATVGNDGFGQC